MVQVPKAAVEGKFKAPVIYEADPYAAGMTMSSFESGKGKITYEQLLNQPRQLLKQTRHQASEHPIPLLITHRMMQLTRGIASR